MLENDYLKISKSLDKIGQRHFFDEEENFINPYQNRIKAQNKCNHMWPNDTDALYITFKGRRKCAICGKEF